MKNLIGFIGAALGIILVFSILATLPVWLCWNWIIAGVLGMPSLTIPQSWGLLVLCGCLFKSSGSSE